MKIQHSTAFVTGASRGLGLELAKQLLARGATKVYAGVRDPGAFHVAGLIAIQLDVTDPASIAAAAAQCPGTSLLINNAGIARITGSTLSAALIATAREIFETNFYGVVATTQAFVPALSANGPGAIINVLSDATWYARPELAAYAAAKSAAWSYTNALRVELRQRHLQVLGLHMGFMDTDMTQGFDMPKTSPQLVAARTLDALESGAEEVLADESAATVKRGLSAARPYYLDPPAIA